MQTDSSYSKFKSFLIPMGTATRSLIHRMKRRPTTDSLIHAGLWFVAVLVFVILGIIIYFLFSNGLPAFTQIGLEQMLMGSRWNPTAIVGPSFGMLPLMMGTLVVSLIAAAIAIPIGLGCTIYLAEIAGSRSKSFLKPAIEVLAGIPSVLYGLFALIILSGGIRGLFGGTGWNALNGGIMLAVMMIPILVTLAEDAINAVPRELKEASFALGSTRWETMKGVIIPAALPGIVAAIILSLGRAIGETMVVLMATGNSPIPTLNPLSSVQPMTATIAIEMGEVASGSLHFQALFAIGCLLFVITFIINSIAELVMARYAEAYR